jgi:hypothetical protein
MRMRVDIAAACDTPDDGASLGRAVGVAVGSPVGTERTSAYGKQPFASSRQPHSPAVGCDVGDVGAAEGPVRPFGQDRGAVSCAHKPLPAVVGFGVGAADGSPVSSGQCMRQGVRTGRDLLRARALTRALDDRAHVGVNVIHVWRGRKAHGVALKVEVLDR